MAEFPDWPCMVCKNKIIAPKDGLVVIDDFAEHLEDMIREHCTPEAVMQNCKPDFVNAVTREYFAQFYDLFHPNKSDVIELGEAMKDCLVDMKAHIHRLKTVLEVSHKVRDSKDGTEYEHSLQLCLLAHYGCVPIEGPKQYPIELERIQDPRDAIEWTIHLEEKSWWNPYGWTRMLEALYGRKET
jgi:hypothetical protein